VAQTKHFLRSVRQPSFVGRGARFDESRATLRIGSESLRDSIKSKKFCAAAGSIHVRSRTLYIGIVSHVRQPTECPLRSEIRIREGIWLLLISLIVSHRKVNCRPV